jgi:glutamyl-tRNA synthetase
MVTTRFAPSPTGFLHIGGARTALFSWAYAKKHAGKFILRIEDTDIERSTQASVDSIINAMNWLGLNYDEGPYYQTKRLERYKSAIQELLNNGHAYYCYCSREELDEMRNEKLKRGEKPKYDRRCLHNPIKKPGVAPVVRFNNPQDGSVVWHDLVKGKIEFSNSELDDLIIARSDGTPTYNFCVVIDDLDMQVTHVIRGDDHVNNTPRQINILAAFAAKIPNYAHVPMILRDDGQKMSKRTDAVSVMDYKGLGILPEALLNYLARLCFGHGNDEIFTLNQFVEWFDLAHVSSSPARFDLKKLYWVNGEHIKTKDISELALLVQDELQANGVNLQSGPNLPTVLAKIRDRSDNLIKLVDECSFFYQRKDINSADASQYLTNESLAILEQFAAGLTGVDWNLDGIKQYIKDFCTIRQIKMPQLGMPLRLKMCGTTSAPSVDLIMELLGRDEVVSRINTIV